MFTLENNYLSIQVKTKGAELCSIFNKETQLEYLWQAGEAWPKHAPILFPIVGKLKDNTYLFNEKSFSLSQHGFARDMEFVLSSSSTDELVLTLNSSEATYEKYPFKFKLDIIYRLKDKALEVETRTTNLGPETMYFSIGFHPAFKIPLVDSTDYSDYYLEFNRTENIERWSIEGGLIGKPYHRVLQNENKLPLSNELFNADALVFKGLESDKISIKCQKTEHGLDFSFKNFPFLGIWAKPNANFVCLEPWHGIADEVESTMEFKNKEGIRSLLQNEQFTCGYEVLTF
ncbi:aldose 1-epimerase family protein [Solitalea sp. MAHUQ-68]|uniref:Aldose 1-epimerase family protein n=1 Tax=Solitalea agri TaxID=2953739 RepID=A0A9X2F371_9SPHI|nr:aldose 1-epimerase family protein [Solitalea agri]MCO4291541.1 aldose 1-epimerase family protein [Solitalea agri]